MRHFMNPELEMRLARLEHMLSRPGRAKATAIQEAKHYLMRAVESAMHGSLAFRGMGPEMEENLHLLMRRVDRAHTAEEIRDVMRDFRQHTLTVSSVAQTRDMEERLHELESQIKSMAESTSAAADTEEKVVTLEKLRGKRVLFTVMPFQEDFRDVWVGGIQRAASGTGLTPIRIDMITKSSEVTDDIVSAIELSEVVVVDVTRNNPNVMFEFGFTLARNKPHIVISQSTEFLTFDIKNVRTLLYQNTWQGIEKLHKDLQSFIKGTVGDKKRKK